jgi:protein-S-isoprenylcysteine O-methyltransferase Ste14
MERREIDAVLFEHRESLLVLLAVPVIISALRGGAVDHPDALLGIAVAGAGVLLRLLAIRHIGRGARVFRPHASSGIVRTGPYRWTRNPLYVAASLMLCGLALVAGVGVWAWALVPATWLAYTPVVIVEERALAAQCGEAYVCYARQVPRWIGLRHAPQTSGARLDWPAVFHREKKLVPWMGVAMVAILAVRGEWMPLPALARRIEAVLAVDLALIAAGGALIAITVNAAKVEHHQRRQRARDLARASQAAAPTDADR